MTYERTLEMPQVEIYYANICGLCTKAIDFFRTRNVTFTAYAVEWNEREGRFVDSPNTRAMYRRCAEEVDFVPQMFIGKVHIRGWRQLEPMIASGEIDRIIAK